VVTLKIKQQKAKKETLFLTQAEADAIFIALLSLHTLPLLSADFA